MRSLTHNKRWLRAALLAACVSVTGLANAQTNRTAINQPVAGPVTVAAHTISADVTVTAGRAKSLRVSVAGPATKVTLVKKGKTYHLRFDGLLVLRSGKITIQLPVGSHVRLATVSGDIRVTGIKGDVQLRSVSGDVKIKDARKVEVAAVSGDIILREIRGPVTAKSVSGDINIETTGRANSRLRTSTTSGDLRWVGRCGKGCSIRINTLSGGLALILDKASAFALKYSSFSGGFKDDLGLKIHKSSASGHGGRSVRATYGAGTGKIKVRSFSGRLKLKKK